MKYTEYSDIKRCHNSLKQCSYDQSHDEYMTNSYLSVIDFDLVKRKYLTDRQLDEKKAHSVDSLAEGENQMYYLIEFKNGDCKTERHGIHLKLRDSLLVLCDICHTSIEETRKNVIFVLVFNSERTFLSSLDKMAMGKAMLSGKPCPLYQLEKAAGSFVQNVQVYSKEMFEKKLLPKLVSTQ